LLNVLIIFLGLLIFIISFYLYIKIAGKLTFPTFTSLFFFYYIIFAFVGSMLFVLKICFPTLENIYSVNNKILLEQFLLVCTGFLIIGIVMYATQKILKFSPKKDTEYYFSKPIENIISPQESFFMPFFCINLCLGLILVGLVLSQIRGQRVSWPILSAFVSQMEYVKGRVILADALKKGHWLIAGTMLLKFNTYISFIYAYLKKTWKWKTLFTLLFILTFFIVIIPGTKGRIIFFFVELILIKFFLDYQKHIMLKKNIEKLYLKYISGGLIIVIFMSFVLFGTFTEKPFLVAKQIFHRVFIGQIEGLYHILGLYPEPLDFLCGKGFANPGGILPYEPIFVSEQLARYLFPESVNLKTFLSLNTIFYGDAYANFGWLGVILSIIMAGIIIQIMNVFFVKYFKKNAITLSIYVILITEWLSASFGDLNTILLWGVLDYYLLFIVGFTMYYFSKHFKYVYLGRTKK